MKRLLTVVLMCCAAVPGFAANYDCSVVTAKGETPIFKFDTETQENVNAPIVGAGEATCIAFRSQPELLACSMAFEPHGSVTGIAELGSAVLSVRAESKGQWITLQCVKK